MQYYFILFIATLLIGALSFVIWQRTRDLSFMIGIGLIYYFTLYGSWFFIYDQLFNNEGKELFNLNYYYLLHKMFPITLNGDYAFTLIIYSLFIVVLLGSVILFLRPTRPTFIHLPTPIKVSHIVILCIVIAAGLLSYYLIRDSIIEAIVLQKSAYVISRAGEVHTGEAHRYKYFTIHKLLLRVAIIMSFLGFAVYLSGAKARCLKGGRGWLIMGGYLLTVAALFLFCIILGNKNELFAGAIGGLLLYNANTGGTRIRRLLIPMAAAVLLIATIDYFRSIPTGEIVSSFEYGRFFASMLGGLVSNEAFASHFSLYGVLNNNVELTYGSSLVSLAASVIPRIFWIDRPASIYEYYSGVFSTITDQGFTIHHATGWYLNFGLIGVVGGAVIFGVFWANIFNLFQRQNAGNSPLYRVFSIVTPWTFVAGIAFFIRAGIESYKSLFIYSIITPTIVIYLSYIVPKIIRMFLPVNSRALRLSRLPHKP